MSKATLLALAALLLAPGVLAQSWNGFGHDAGRTFATSERGPAWGEIALRFEVPDLGAWDVVMADDRAFALVADEDGCHLATLDLVRGGVERLAPAGPPESTYATMAREGDRVFTICAGEVHAFALDGTPLWTWRDEGAPAVYDHTRNSMVAVVDGRVIASATHRRTLDEPASALDRLATHSFADSAQGFVVMLDAATGEPYWIARNDMPAPPRSELGLGVPRPGLLPASPNAMDRILYGFAATPEVVILLHQDGSGPGTPAGVFGYFTALRALSPVDGSTLWETDPRPPWTAVATSEGIVSPLGQPASSLPAISGSSVFAKMGGLVSVNLRTGEVLWEEPLGAEDVTQGSSSASPAASEEALFVTSTSTLYRFDRVDHGVDWRRSLAAGQSYLSTPLVARDALYVPLFASESEGGRLLAVDPEDGSELWSLEVAHSSYLYGVHDGLLFGVDAALEDGKLTNFSYFVVGRTEASPVAEVALADAYPAPGEPVRVDLGGSRRGLQGDVVAYRVDWGDGAGTGWSESPRFEHAYAEPGEVQARAYVRTAGGQTASEPFTVHVGGERPNAISLAFSPERQDATFFLLGLVATAIGGGIGLLRVQRKRSRLAEELRLLDESVNAAGADPAAIDRAIDDARLRARTHLIGAKLDEAQHAVLLARIEELSRERRLDVVERSLDFLPYRHVRALREMLQDGRVSTLERAHFLALLDADPMLTPEYKERVRQVVQAWSAHDAAPRR